VASSATDRTEHRWTFHEALNLARVILEAASGLARERGTNLWMEYTRTTEVTSL